MMRTMPLARLFAPCFVSILSVPGLAQPELAGPGLAIYPPANLGAVSHRLSPGTTGLILSWQEAGPQGVRLCWSRLTEDGWSGAGVVTEQRTRIVSNWADVPAVVDGGDGAMYAHWLRQPAPGSPGYDIVVLRSADAGQTWTELGMLNDDGVAAEHGFVSYVPVAEGVRAYWLDGRETGGSMGDPDIRAHGRMTLRTAIIGEAIAPSELLDEAVCDCCRTSAVATPEGPRVVYRDRAQGEIRDIAILGGPGPDATPRIVHADGWKMPGCPVNGPEIVAEGRRVGVVWYTAAEGARIQAAFSEDAGATFADPILIDKTVGASIPVGRVDAVMDGEDLIVCWLRNERRKGGLFIQRITPSGPVGEATKVGPMDSAAASGFPQMERFQDELVICWRDADANRLQTVRIPVESVGR